MRACGEEMGIHKGVRECGNSGRCSEVGLRVWLCRVTTRCTGRFALVRRSVVILKHCRIEPSSPTPPISANIMSSAQNGDNRSHAEADLAEVRPAVNNCRQALIFVQGVQGTAARGADGSRPRVPP